MDKKQEPVSSDDYLSSREVASLLNVSVSTVLKMLERGVLTAWRTEGGHRRFDRATVTALREKQSGRAKTSRRALSVLVVEDDEQMRELYQWEFGEWGLPVNLRIVGTGIDGLIEIGREYPDLLILDLMMADVNGFTLLQRLRPPSHHQLMNIIVVSGLDAAAIKAAGGLPPGVVHWIKPLRFAQLRGFVEGLLASRAD